MTERIRWCQYHQANHVFPLHCKVCGGDLPEGRYYQCRPCKQQKEANCRAEIDKRKETAFARSLAAKDQEKLAKWIEAQKP